MQFLKLGSKGCNFGKQDVENGNLKSKGDFYVKVENFLQNNIFCKRNVFL